MKRTHLHFTKNLDNNYKKITLAISENTDSFNRDIFKFINNNFNISNKSEFSNTSGHKTAGNKPYTYSNDRREKVVNEYILISNASGNLENDLSGNLNIDPSGNLENDEANNEDAEKNNIPREDTNKTNSQSNTIDLYRLPELNFNTNKKLLKKFYKKLIVKLHPDKRKKDSDPTLFQEYFEECKHAMEIKCIYKGVKCKFFY